MWRNKIELDTSHIRVDCSSTSPKEITENPGAENHCIAFIPTIFVFIIPYPTPHNKCYFNPQIVLFQARIVVACKSDVLL